MAVWHHLKRLQKYNSERWAHWQQSGVAQPRGRRPTHRAGARNSGSGARAKEGRKERQGPTPATSMRAQSCRRGPAEDHSTELRSRATMQRCTYRAEGPYSSHHHSGAPRPGAPRLGRGFCGYGYALHTNTDNAPPVQVLAGGVRHCCARRHAGHPPLPTTSPGPSGRMRPVGLRTRGGGGGSDNKGDGLASQPRRYRVPGQPLLNRHEVGGVSRSPDGLFAQQKWEPIRGRPTGRGKRTYGGRPGQRVEEQGTWASQKRCEAGCGRPVDKGVWTAKTVKRPRQQPAHPQYANYWAPLTRKRHTMPHSAQPQHTNYWAPRTRKRH